MDKQAIIRMAREAGFESHDVSLNFRKELERFAALVTAAAAKEHEGRLRFTRERWEIECKSQIEIEREACAKVCESLPAQQDVDVRDQCAAAIRARSNT